LLNSVVAITAVVTFGLLDFDELVSSEVVFLDLIFLLVAVEEPLGVSLLLALLLDQNLITFGYSNLVLLQRYADAKLAFALLEEGALTPLVVVVIYKITKSILQVIHLSDILLVLSLYAFGEGASQGCLQIFHFIEVNFLLCEGHFGLIAYAFLMDLKLRQVLLFQAAHFTLNQVFLLVVVVEVVHVFLLRHDFFF